MELNGVDSWKDFFLLYPSIKPRPLSLENDHFSLIRSWKGLILQYTAKYTTANLKRLNIDDFVTGIRYAIITIVGRQTL